MTSPVSDEGLLDLAILVMQQNGYEAVRDTVGDLPIALAEDEDNIVVLASLVSSGDVVLAEPDVSRLLTERLVAATSARKKWDAYVVLLTAQRASDEQSETLAALTNNLRQVRRIVRVGVDPTRAAVARALLPLLPLPTPDFDSRLEDPLAALKALLIRDGLPADVVSDALSAYALEEAESSTPLEEDETEVAEIGESDGD
jgi:hypothetical protein